MLVANDLAHDGRVRKTAASIARAGYSVTVLGIAEETRRARIGDWELHLLPLQDPVREELERAKSEAAVHKARATAAAQQAKLARARARQARKRLLTAHGLASYLAACLAFGWARAAHGLALRRHRAATSTIDAAKRSLAARRSDPLADDRYERSWGEALLALRPDIIHVHDHHGLPAAFQAAERLRRDGRRLAVIYDAHEYLSGRESAKKLPSGRRGKALSNDAVVIRERVLAPQADAVITVSEPVAALLAAELSLRERPTVVYNAPARSHGPSPNPGLREIAGVGADVPLVVYAGSVGPRRGIDTLLGAVARVPDVHLVLVVDAEKPYTHELFDLAAELGIRARVHHAPFAPVDAVVPYLAEATIGAFTPPDDSANRVVFPNKLLEYTHAGLALLVSDLGEIGRFVRMLGVGETHAPGDAEDCARALRRILEDPRRYRANREAIVEQWSWEAQEPRLLSVYERVEHAIGKQPTRSDRA